MGYSRGVQLEAYRNAADLLLGLIRGEKANTRTAAGRRGRAEAKLARTRCLLDALGNPQSRFPVVHVTGTSGKGSTSAAISAILTAAGYRVGLRTSPYLQVATEKLQIGPALIDAMALDRLTRRVVDVGRGVVPAERPGNRIGYAEVWSAIAMLWFAERQVDVAVVEVGAGGRFDSTNAVDSEVSVITSVGLDHVKSLGPTIADIAWHKAGIIKPDTIVVVGGVPPEAWCVIREEARMVGARIVQATDFPLPAAGASKMNGGFQRSNARIAVAVARSLTERGFAIPDAAVTTGLASARMPGRLERMPNQHRPLVWIDGAHNADKIGALARESSQLTTGHARPVIVLGVLGSKDAGSIAAGLRSAGSTIICTEPSVHGKRPLCAEELKAAVTRAGFAGDIIVERDPPCAVERAGTIARANGSSVLITGSMYLAGQARRRWYPDDEIVFQRTPWPKSIAADD